MHEYFFANYRLLTDDGIANHESTKRLAGFTTPMPYTHTFTLRLGDVSELEERRAWALGCPTAFETEFFTIHDTGEGWAFVNTLADERRLAEGARNVLLCSRDYSDMTAYVTDRTFNVEWGGHQVRLHASIPMSGSIRTACEAGMVTRGGLPLHAAMVEADGFGVAFLGPSGAGKSTQARLWERYLGADFLIGDRPVLRKLGGKWYGFGMPWDGKDEVYRQVSVPVRALVWLEQAKENRILPMKPVQAMSVMLKQAMMPVWDDAAMDGAAVLMGAVARELPMYHLRCLPDEAAARLTYETICKSLPLEGKVARSAG